MIDLNRDPRTKVLIATPHTGALSWQTHKMILDLYRKTDPEKIALHDEGCAGSNIAFNQNVLAKLALENGMDYLLFVEADVCAPGEALNLLVGHGKDIIGCTTAYKDADLLARNLADEKANLRYMGQELDGAAITFRSLVEGPPIRRVSFVPMGLTLISTKAIRAVMQHRRAGQDNLKPGMEMVPFFHAEAILPEHQWTAITTTDSSFCHAAAAAGMEIWLDARLSLMTSHEGSANYAMLPQTWAPPEMLKAANA